MKKMKNAGSTVVAIILGVAGILAASAWQPASAGGSAPVKPIAKASKAPKAKAAKTAKAAPSDHCAIDDLGFDSMLAKKSDAPAAPVAKKAQVDTIAQSKAAADKFDLGRKTRGATRPSESDEVKMEAKTLSTAAVGTVVAEKQGDLEYCLMNIPEAERGSEEFTLHLTIAPKGTVTDASVSGSENAEKIEACVQSQVKRWTFPQADAPTEIDYPLAFHLQHIDN
jgi:hypothetical protein